MLKLSRNVGESIYIDYGGGIWVQVYDCKESLESARIGIEAPSELHIAPAEGEGKEAPKRRSDREAYSDDTGTLRLRPKSRD